MSDKNSLTHTGAQLSALLLGIDRQTDNAATANLLVDAGYTVVISKRSILLVRNDYKGCPFYVPTDMLRRVWRLRTAKEVTLSAKFLDYTASHSYLRTTDLSINRGDDDLWYRRTFRCSSMFPSYRAALKYCVRLAEDTPTTIKTPAIQLLGKLAELAGDDKMRLQLSDDIGGGFRRLMFEFPSLDLFGITTALPATDRSPIAPNWVPMT